jgi:hypothetical protein
LRLVEYLYGEMSPEEEAEFVDRLEQQPKLKEQVAAYGRLKGELDVLGNPEPPPELVADILSRAARPRQMAVERQQPVPRSALAEFLAFLIRPQFGLGLAAVLVIAVGLYMVREARRPLAPGSPQDVRERLKPKVTAPAEKKAEKKEKAEKKAEETIAERSQTEAQEKAELREEEPSAIKVRDEVDEKSGDEAQAPPSDKSEATVAQLHPATEQAAAEEPESLPAGDEPRRVVADAEMPRAGLDGAPEANAGLVAATADREDSGGRGDVDKSNAGSTGGGMETRDRKKKEKASDLAATTAVFAADKQKKAGKKSKQASVSASTKKGSQADEKEGRVARVTGSDSLTRNALDNAALLKNAESRRKSQSGAGEEADGGVADGPPPPLIDDVRKETPAKTEEGVKRGQPIIAAPDNEAAVEGEGIVLSAGTEEDMGDLSTEDFDTTVVEAPRGIDEDAAGGAVSGAVQSTVVAEPPPSVMEPAVMMEKTSSKRKLFSLDFGGDDYVAPAREVEEKKPAAPADQDMEFKAAKEEKEAIVQEEKKVEVAKKAEAQVMSRAEPGAAKKDSSISCAEEWAQVVSHQSAGRYVEAMEAIKQFKSGGPCASFYRQERVSLKEAELLIARGEKKKARKILKKVRRFPAVEREAMELMDQLE